VPLHVATFASMATSNGKLRYTTPGLETADAERVVAILQDRLNATTDLHLTLKHVHWNVVGPHFIAVHEMIDPQVDAVRGFSDAIAERIATLGGSPVGTPGALVQARTWDEYSIGRATTQEHLGALDLVYQGVISDYRKNIAELDELDLVTQDMLIAHTDSLELFHWFVRAHLEDKSGAISTSGADSEAAAAEAAQQNSSEAKTG
jgi:starvation-inducible DNA-binding protein